MLLQQIAWASIVDVGVVLEPLDQRLLVRGPIRVVVELGNGAVVGRGVGVLRKLSLRVL